MTLRRLDTSPSTPLSDRLDDTNTHVRLDTYTNLVVTGELTVATYEIVARPRAPCTGNHCRSESHHDTPVNFTEAVATDAWSTRITARLMGGAPVFDVTINSTSSPDLDGAVQRAFQDARRALSQPAGPAAVVRGPGLVSSASRWVAQALLRDTARLTQSSGTLREAAYPRICVGDLGDLASPPAKLPSPPCRNPAWTVTLVDGGCHQFGCIPAYIPVDSVHTHTQRDVYAGLFVTGTLTTVSLRVRRRARDDDSHRPDRPLAVRRLGLHVRADARKLRPHRRAGDIRVHARLRRDLRHRDRHAARARRSASFPTPLRT